VKQKKGVAYLLWLVLLLSFAGLSAWLISSHFPARTLESAFWFCLLGGFVTSVILATFNWLEASVILLVLLGLSVASTGVLTRLHFPTAGYIMTAASLIGFASTRVFRGDP